MLTAVVYYDINCVANADIRKRFGSIGRYSRLFGPFRVLVQVYSGFLNYWCDLWSCFESDITIRQTTATARVQYIAYRCISLIFLIFSLYYCRRATRILRPRRIIEYRSLNVLMTVRNKKNYNKFLTSKFNEIFKI